MVRTVAPLTSAQTVTKVNTYLPMFEKMSTLLGMYSFLNRAQTFRPIQSMSTNSPIEAVTALMKNPGVSKMITQPLLANNMEKIMGSMAMNMIKNGNFNEILSSIAKSDGNPHDGSSGLDINGLMETFMPLLNSMTANSDHDHENLNDGKEIKFKNESVLPDGESEDSECQINLSNENEKSTNDEKHPPKNEYDRYYKNDRYESHEKAVNYNENKNNYTEKKEIHKPIRIKQRRKR